MKVSVILPVYNEQDYLPACLDSLMKQIEPADEIIVVDNNSTDRSVEIAKSYGVKVMKESRQGQTFARNTGFDEASGEVLARTDADTILPPDWVKRIKQNFADKNLAGLTGPPKFDQGSIRPNVIYNRFVRLLIGHPPFFGPNMALTKIGWEKVRDEACANDKRLNEDTDLAMHLARYGVIKFDPDLTVTTSGRRLKQNPFYFLFGYWIKNFNNLKNHPRARQVARGDR